MAAAAHTVNESLEIYSVSSNFQELSYPYLEFGKSEKSIPQTHSLSSLLPP